MIDFFESDIKNDGNEIDGLIDSIYSDGIVIVTAGVGGICTYIWAEENCIKIKGIGDNSEDKVGKNIGGCAIEKTNSLLDKFRNEVNYIIATYNYDIYMVIYKQLTENGIKNGKIFHLSICENKRFKMQFNWHQICGSSKYEIIAGESDIKKVIDYLEDDISVNVYKKMLCRHYNGYGYTMPEELYTLNGYFNHDFFKEKKCDEGVLIQCGVFNGDTIKDYIDQTPNYKCVIGIEADEECFNNSKWVEKYENVKLIHAAICEENKTIRFAQTGNAGSRICETGNAVVNGIRGDDLGIEPTFIQMDIEGGELSALKGFENTIKKHKPQLAICIYHSVKEHWTIPEYIKSIVPEYKFFVRNDSPVCNNIETVLFATL